MIVLMFFFFFSSRRRHTRLTCDWSTDVCSSDLGNVGGEGVAAAKSGPEVSPSSKDFLAVRKLECILLVEGTAGGIGGTRIQIRGALGVELHAEGCVAR